jgi:hypothetical protein
VVKVPARARPRVCEIENENDNGSEGVEEDGGSYTGVQPRPPVSATVCTETETEAET